MKNTIYPFLLTGLTVAFAGFFVSYPLQPAPEGQVYVAGLTGTADVRRGGKDSFEPLARGMVIDDRSVIKTGNDSWVEIVFEDHRIEIGASTELEIESLATSETEPVKLHLKNGFAWFQFDTGGIFAFLKKAREYQVITPTAVASVRGTKFSVNHGPEGMGACVCHGSIDSQAKKGDAVKETDRGSTIHYDKAGAAKSVDLSPYFRGKLADPAFLEEIEPARRESYSRNCMHCHKKSSRQSLEFQEADSDY